MWFIEVLQVWFIEVLQVVHWVTTSTAGGSLGYYRCGSLRDSSCGSGAVHKGITGSSLGYNRYGSLK